LLVAAELLIRRLAEPVGQVGIPGPDEYEDRAAHIEPLISSVPQPLITTSLSQFASLMAKRDTIAALALCALFRSAGVVVLLDGGAGL